MRGMGMVHWSANDIAGAMPWFDRLLPIAERLGLLETMAAGILGRGAALVMMGRPREGMVLLRGAHQLAVANDLRDVERNARVMMTFYEQWGEPAAGLALAREGLEIGRRRGSRAYGLWMVGNGCVCALRTGDWDWAAGLLDEWLALGSATIEWAELLVDRAILRSLRGEDATEDIAEAARIRLEAGTTGPQWEAYGLWARAWAAFAAGRPDEVRRLGEHAVELAGSFAPLVGPLLARSALWAGDAPGAASALASMDASGYLGPALAADRLVARAGIDALEGRGPAALAGYREALRAYRKARARLRRGGGGRGHGRPAAIPGAGRPRRRDGDRRRPRHARASRRAPVPRPPRRGPHDAARPGERPAPCHGLTGRPRGDPGPDASSGQGLTYIAPYGQEP